MVAALIMARGYKAAGFHRQAKTAATWQPMARRAAQIELEVAREFPGDKGVPENDMPSASARAFIQAAPKT
jgi:hypothetical protein